MLALKSEPPEDLTSHLSPEASKELAFLKRTIFTFDMDRETPHSSRNNPRRSRSISTPTNNTQGRRQPPGENDDTDVQDAALLAQFAAAAATQDLNMNQVYHGMLSQSTYPSMPPAPNFYNNFLPQGSMPPPQLPPLASLPFPWASLPPHPSQLGHVYEQGSSSSRPPDVLSTNAADYVPRLTPGGQEALHGSNTRRGEQSSSRSSPASTSQNQAELDQAMSEEKRRRNTAASARFRVKKKHKTITLERSVSDLTGRAEELEREVADLRRENGWLKEIVMLKGTQFAANNAQHRQALTQAALAVGRDFSADAPIAGPSRLQSGTGSSPGAGGSSVHSVEEGTETDSEPSDEDADFNKTKLGKGKQRARK